jgi:hypothetical protein
MLEKSRFTFLSSQVHSLALRESDSWERLKLVGRAYLELRSDGNLSAFDDLSYHRKYDIHQEQDYHRQEDDRRQNLWLPQLNLWLPQLKVIGGAYLELRRNGNHSPFDNLGYFGRAELYHERDYGDPDLGLKRRRKEELEKLESTWLEQDLYISSLICFLLEHARRIGHELKLVRSVLSQTQKKIEDIKERERKMILANVQRGPEQREAKQVRRHSTIAEAPKYRRQRLARELARKVLASMSPLGESFRPFKADDCRQHSVHSGSNIQILGAQAR